MNQLTKAEILTTYCQHVIYGLDDDRDSPISKAKRKLIEQAADMIAAVSAEEIEGTDQTELMERAWAKMLMDSSISGVESYVSRHYSEAAMMSTLDVMNLNGESLEMFDVMKVVSSSELIPTVSELELRMSGEARNPRRTGLYQQATAV